MPTRRHYTRRSPPTLRYPPDVPRRERLFLLSDDAREHRPRIVAAVGVGWLPPVKLGDDVLGGVGDAELVPLDVPTADILQLVERRRLPRWVGIGGGSFGPGYVELRALMRQSVLNTVCEEARCPNIGRCWSRGTATFMISGSSCTRGCRFCNVLSAKPVARPDPDEPQRVAEAAAQMGLKFVVVTAVARDDLPDGGARHFAATVAALRDRLPDALVEVLIPDLRGNWDALEVILESGPDVLNHNTETVPRLYKRVRPGARYERTLELLERSRAAGLRTKSGLMVGLGEELGELERVFADLDGVGCELVTIGQYLQPSPDHLPVERFYVSAEYAALAEMGHALGLAHVESGPLVRSSFEADRVAESVAIGA
ncbi:MAG: lipoyl synthase [Actinobacteria bacterium]|nr:lipoyl synthase [Actinomycetota bacterium]